MRRCTSRAPGVAHHLDDLARRRAADDRVVDDDDALAAQHRLDGAELQAHAEVTDALLRLDERAADVVRPDEAHLERHVALRRVADGRGDARVRDGNDDVGLDGVLARERATERLARVVDAPAAELRVRTGEVDVLEDAHARAAPAASAAASACRCRR